MAPSWAVLSDGWKGKPKDRAVEAGATETLVIEFASHVAPIDSEYAIILDLGEDCLLEFASEGFLKDGYAVVETHFPSLIGADRLHKDGVTGRGVTIAFLDTGNSLVSSTMHYNSDRNWRYLAQYDALEDEALREGDPSFGAVELDGNGHGGHVASIALSAKSTPQGKYNGVAPGADLVVVRAFDADGAGSYLDVIRGIDWIVANKDLYGIRVLNLSFSAEPRSHYWDDPLNQAVMAAWRAGIVVVASAGNRGPDPMTIGVPGNVPVHHHGRGDVRQLHAGSAGRRCPDLVLLGRPDRRGLRQARDRRAGRPHPRHDRLVHQARKRSSRLPRWRTPTSRCPAPLRPPRWSAGRWHCCSRKSPG